MGKNVLRTRIVLSVLTLAFAGALVFGILFLIQAPGKYKPFSRKVFYQIMVDRFATDKNSQCSTVKNGRLDEFLGGNLSGISNNMDFLKDLGVDAVLLSPVYQNQDSKLESYHGYWPVDFLKVDKRFGSEDQLTALVEGAHKRGIKVYLDFIFNHTADVFEYRDCNRCSFSSERQAPREPVSKIRKPEWLNDPIHYNFQGEYSLSEERSVVNGDFKGLDDLRTDSIFVQNQLIEIHKWWIKKFNIDGFRIDLANMISPSLLQRIQVELNRTDGIILEYGNYALERYRKLNLAQDSMILNIPLEEVIVEYLSGKSNDREFLEKLKNNLKASESWINQVSSPDFGRIRFHLKNGKSDDTEKLAMLSYGLLITLSKNIIILYGDELGLKGLGGRDAGAREPIFGECDDQTTSRIEHNAISLNFKSMIKQLKNLPEPDFVNMQFVGDGLLKIPFVNSKTFLIFNFSSQTSIYESLQIPSLEMIKKEIPNEL